MPVSSLIFVVIVAIWAAYLVQHWMRRREDAAAHRSVEDFSEAMRVLEKRPALPGTEPRSTRPHSYGVTPARPARSSVEVKRAVPAARRQSPLVARRTDDDLEEFHVEPEVGAAPAHHDRPAAPVRRVSMAQRRIRAAVLLAAVLWIPASITLAVTGVLMWVSVPFAVATVVAVLFWLRTEAQHDRIRAAAVRRVRRVRDARSTRSRAAEPVLTAEDTQVIQSTVAGTAPAQPAARARGTRTPLGVDRVVIPAPGAVAEAAASATHEAVFDVQAARTGAVPVSGTHGSDDSAPAVASGPAGQAEASEAADVPQVAEAAPGSWSPVPVPKPTYTLKAKAEPRFTDSGIPADVFETPEFADEAEELDDRALFARRAASQ